jgi:hypothetical protein
MVLLDLDELGTLDRRLRLFSLGRFNLYSFDPRRHGDGSSVPLKTQVAARLGEAGIAAPGLKVSLLTMPRLLGFAFNPISVYFCADGSGQLVAILYEVNNTFGERHSYLLAADEGTGIPVEQAAPKRFHVSPFMAMDQHYAFRVNPPGERLGLAITSRDAEGPLLSAVLDLKRSELSDATLLRTFAAMPLMTFKVVAGIGWEAFKLWLKRVPVHRKPAAPAAPFTVVRTRDDRVANPEFN